MTSDPIAAARTFLPLWAVWLPVASFACTAALAAIFAFLTIALASRPLRRLPPDAHWTERARLIWSVRRSVALSVILAAAVSGPLTIGGPISRPGVLLRWLCPPILAIAAGLAVAFTFENRFVRRLPLATRWRSVASYAVLILPTYVVSVVFAVWATWAGLSLAWSLVAGVVVLVFAIGGGPWLGQLIGLARPPTPRLLSALARAQSGVAEPRVRLLILQIANANAFAFQLTRTIGVSVGALECLDDDDLVALLAHELGHLREPRAIVALRTLVAVFIPMALVVVPWVIRLADTFYWIVLWVCVVGVLLLFRRLQRALERRADAVAGQASPAYAAALEKVYRWNPIPAVLRRTATHPDLYDRMVAAGVTPTWSRPRPPPSLVGIFVVLVLLASGAFGALTYARRSLSSTSINSQQRLTFNLAVEGGAYEAGQLAYWHLAHSHYDAALALLRAAEEMDPSNVTWPSLAAFVLSSTGHCEQAVRALNRALAIEPESGFVRTARELVSNCVTSENTSSGGQ